MLEGALAALVVLVTWSAPLFQDNPPGAAAMRTRGRETWEEDTDLNSGQNPGNCMCAGADRQTYTNCT